MNSPFLVCSHHVQQKLHHAADMHNRKGLRYTVLYIQAQKAPTGALNIMNRQNSFSSENDNFASEKASVFKCLLRPKLSLLSMNFTSITQIFMIVDLNPWLW